MGSGATVTLKPERRTCDDNRLRSPSNERTLSVSTFSFYPGGADCFSGSARDPSRPVPGATPGGAWGRSEAHVLSLGFPAADCRRAVSGVTGDRDDLIMIQVRLPRELVREVDHWAIDQDLYRAHAVAALLRAGLEVAAEREGDEG